MDKQTHDGEHNSKTSPVPGCEHCALEVVRRVRRCFGDGSSTVPAPVKGVADGN